jgi:hypothetical protein
LPGGARIVTPVDSFPVARGKQAPPAKPARQTSCLRPARVFVPNLPGDPESADGRLRRLSRSRLLASGDLDPLARGGLKDLLIE